MRDRQLHHHWFHHLRLRLQPPDLRCDELHRAVRLGQDERDRREFITYTSTGNMTGVGTTPTMTYNKANKMASSMISGTTSTYLYDALRQPPESHDRHQRPSVTEYDTAGQLL